MTERDVQMMVIGMVTGAVLTTFAYLVVYVTAGHTCVQLTQAATCGRVWVPGEAG